MAELIGTASVRVQMDTRGAEQAIRLFARRTRDRLQQAERSVSGVTTELRALRTAAQNVRVDIDVGGRTEITAATTALDQLRDEARGTPARIQVEIAGLQDLVTTGLAIRDLRNDAAGDPVRVTIDVQGAPEITAAATSIASLRSSATTAAGGLRDIATRSTAAATALQLVDTAATAAARALHVLAGRAVVATTALVALRPAVSGAATALGRLADRSEAALDRLGDLDTGALGASVSIGGLGSAARDTGEDLRDLRGNLPDVSRAMRDATEAADGGGGGRAAGLVGALGSIAALSGAAAAGLGAVVPVAAGLAAAVGQIAPAAGVAATGFLAVQTASAAVKLGMLGVEEAFKNAFDPEKAAEFQEALDKLAPSAQKFVLAIKDMKPEFDKLQLGVQDRLFRGLGAAVERTAASALPVLRTNLISAAAALNEAGRGALAAGRELAESGTLGQALGSATRGLKDLTGIPALAVQAIGQIGAAAGPSFERLTAAAGGAAESLSESLTRGFESGAMERAIGTAVDLAKELGEGLGNVGRIVGNVFGAAEQSGTGLITNFRDITASLADLTAQADVQAGLRSLFQTMGTVGRTAATLFGEAVKAIAPAITALAPHVQTLVRDLGAGLAPVIRAASPLLTGMADAAGRLVSAFSPLIPVVGELLAGALRAATPVITGLLEQAALLAETVMGALGPSLQGLPGIINPVIEFGGKLLALWLRLQNTVLEALQPAIARLGEGFGALVRSAGDLVGVFSGAEGGAKGLESAVRPVIKVVGDLALKVADLVATGLERLAAWASAHRLELLQIFNAGKAAVAEFALAVVENLPLAFAMFRQLALIALDAFGVVANGAATFLGWLPGVGDDIRKGADAFNDFAGVARKGLDAAQDEIGKFSAKATPKLRQNKLEVDISNWRSQIAEAKRQISDKNLPPKKRAKLEANIDDWQKKVKTAESQLRTMKAEKTAKIKGDKSSFDRTLGSVRGAKIATKTARIEADASPFRGTVGGIRGSVVGTAYINIEATGGGIRGGVLGGARGGLVPSGLRPTRGLPGFQTGGSVRGPGTSTSDSIIARVSRDEFVVRAAAVRKYGVSFFEALNSMRMGVSRFANGGTAGAGGGADGGGSSAGKDLAQGLIAGMRASMGAVAAAARAMGATAQTAIRQELEISSPSKKFQAIGKQTGQGFIKGLTGTKAQINATAKSLIAAITKAFKGTGSKVDDRLIEMIEKNNKKLKGLAADRDKIAATIAKAKAFAAEVTATAKATGSLSSIVSEDFFAPNYVKNKMKSALADIKSFTADIQELQKKGLSKALIQQILEMGPEAGGAFAASLADADAATIKQYNKLQEDIDKESKKLGNLGADILFDSGKKAGEGFLAGLKAQQKNIEKLMLDIAKGMQKAIKQALGIKSPSRVMDGLGRLTTLGLAGGIVRPLPAIRRAMGRVASAVTAGAPSPLTAPLASMAQLGTMPANLRAPTAGAAVVNINLTVENHGVLGDQMTVDNWLARAIDRATRQGRLRGLTTAGT
jgi:phage-related protein